MVRLSQQEAVVSGHCREAGVLAASDPPAAVAAASSRIQPRQYNRAEKRRIDKEVDHGEFPNPRREP